MKVTSLTKLWAIYVIEEDASFTNKPQNQQ